MARPFTASDDEILLAAHNVMSRHGPNNFSLSQVASDIGLSRAAIILRFKSTHALKVRLLTRMVDSFSAALATLPKSPSGDNLLRVGAFIGGHIGSREGSLQFLSEHSSNLRDPELVALELRLGDALREAISHVMPPVAIEHSSAVTAFRAHLSGSVMAWTAEIQMDPLSYLVSRSVDWLKLVGIPYSDEVAVELARAQPKAMKPKRARRSKSATGTKRKAPKDL